AGARGPRRAGEAGRVARRALDAGTGAELERAAAVARQETDRAAVIARSWLPSLLAMTPRRAPPSTADIMVWEAERRHVACSPCSRFARPSGGPHVWRK